MPGYEASTTFEASLGPRGHDDSASSREALRQALATTRRNAALIASEIAGDLRSFTRHDESHIDSLWHLADVVADVPVTPTEAFVFGCAASIHDLGLAVAAYPGGITELRTGTAWVNALANVLRRDLHRPPTDADLAAASHEAKQRATEDLLREQHAARADELGLLHWIHPSGAPLFLIESEQLRSAYGWIVGRIAASHGWPLERVHADLETTINPPSGYPADWTVDALRVACLLRATDAAHLDASRAPRLLRAVRRPQGIAQHHWAFQERLHRPTRADDRLRYTSGEPFHRDDAPAWWLAFDMLRMVDEELRGVDSLLLATKRDRFAARGVLGIDSPATLASYLVPDGWEPVDVEIRVTDVANLVERFGGRALYGSDWNAPLRELIQNGADAVRARRAIEGRAGDWGRITVSVQQDSGIVVGVEDTGIGMGYEVLTRHFLDFGRSLWASDELGRIWPGLPASSFQATGQFGIGFFSAFMWGDRIKVTSRRADEGVRDTRVLEIDSVGARPLIRAADEDERLRDGGTRVEVWISREPPTRQTWLVRPPPSLSEVTSARSLSWLCAWLAPALDVDVDVRFGEKEVHALRASDWMSLSGVRLLRRISHERTKSEWPDESAVPAGERVRDIRNANGALAGRATLASGSWLRQAGVITVGGLRARPANIAGLLIGEVPNLARTEARPIWEPEQVRSWATQQASLLADQALYEYEQISLAGDILRCDGDPGALVLCLDAHGNGLSQHDLHGWARSHQRAVLFDDDVISEWANMHEVNPHILHEIEYDEDVLRSPAMGGSGVAELAPGSGRSLPEYIARAVSAAWGQTAVPARRLAVDPGMVEVGTLEGARVELTSQQALVLEKV